MATSSGFADNNNTTTACGCTNITIMQLFHELKQKFPAVPDRVVSDCIRQNYHNKETCEWLLHRENQAYLMHSYPLALKMSTTASESSSPLTSKFQGLSCCDNSLDSDYDEEQNRTALPTNPHLNMFPSSVTAHFFQQADSCHLVSSNSTGITSPFISDDREKSLIHANSPSSRRPSYSQRVENLKHLVPCFDHEGNLRQTHELNTVINSHFSGRSSGFHRNFQESETDVLTHNNSNIGSLECRGKCTKCSVQRNFQQCTSSSVTNVCTSSSMISNHKQLSRPCSLDVPQKKMQYFNSPLSAPIISAPFDSFAHPSGSRCDSSDFISPNALNNPRIGIHNDSSHLLPSHVVRDEEHSHSDNLIYPINNALTDNYELNVSCSVQRSPVTSTANIVSGTNKLVDGRQKVKSFIEVNPTPHYVGRDYFGNMNESSKQPRSYTSVNLTLRPPSSEPQEPIDIRSSGSTLTYSTSSYDPRQGFQSQVQIRIGPGGSGSVSAVRTRTHDNLETSPARPLSWYVPTTIEETELLTPPTRSESLPDISALSQLTDNSEDSLSSQEDSVSVELRVIGGDNLDPPTQALLIRQIERKNKLKRELKREKEKLRLMQREIHNMKRDLEKRKSLKEKKACLALPVVTSVLQKVQQLRLEIQRLQEDCKKMTTEVDLNVGARVPLGETDEEFYKHIYTGQHGSILPSRVRRQNEVRREINQESSEGPNWTCTECTFHNHPLLDKCEQCEMPRIVLGTTQALPPPRLSLNSCYCHPNSVKPTDQLTATQMVPVQLNDLSPLLRSASLTNVDKENH